MAATIQLPESLAGRLEDLAREEGIGLDALITRLMSEHLERRKRPAGARRKVSFPILSMEETGPTRSLTGAEIDDLFADEDLHS